MNNIERTVHRVSWDAKIEGVEYAFDAIVVEQRLPSSRLFEVTDASAVCDNGSFHGLPCMTDAIRAEVERRAVAEAKSRTALETGGEAMPPRGEARPLPKVGHHD